MRKLVNMKNLNNVRNGVIVMFLMAGACLLAGCSGTTERTDVRQEVSKPIPDSDHLVVKPGETKKMAFKRAFDTSAPNTSIK
jgi:hypothetical protein